jgi:DNA-binding GntR family transcriptional regulator
VDDTAPVTLASEVYLTLRERIASCQLAPGQRVTERQLAADLGYGLTPVRQALAKLDSEGLVRTLPRRGYQVTPLTIGSVNELFQVWRIIGPPIAELAAKNIPADVRDQAFNEHFAIVEATFNSDDLVATIEASARFWQWLAESTRNSRLLELYTRLEGELRRVFMLVFKDPAAHEALSPGVMQAWTPGATPEVCRRHAENFIDTSHRLLLGILATWPSVVQAEVVPPGAWDVA